MKIKKVIIDGKEVDFKLPKRYTDKRKAEKELHKLMYPELYEKVSKPVKKIRKTELEIPIDIDKKTVIFVRESKLLSKEKWLKYFDGNVDKAKAYIEAYKQQSNDTEDNI